MAEAKETPETRAVMCNGANSEFQFPFSDSFLDAPISPLVVFNPMDQELIREVSRSLGIPLAMPVATMLAYVSCLLGRTRLLRVARNRKIQAAIWVCITGRPGTRKSPCIDYFFDCIREIQKRPLAGSMLTIMIDEDGRFTQVDAGKLEFIARYTTSNATRAGLEKFLAETPRGITYTPDELTVLKENWKTEADKAVLISAYDGREASRMLHGEQRDIRNPFISIIGSIQPGLIKQVFNDSAASQGYTPRFLFVNADAPCPFSEHSGLSEISETAAKRLEDITCRLIDGKGFATLDLTPEAGILFQSWERELISVIARFSGSTQEMLNKFKERPLRIALLLDQLNMLGDANHEISRDTMGRSLALTNWLMREQLQFWQKYFAPTKGSNVKEAIRMAIAANAREIIGNGCMLEVKRLAEMAQAKVEFRIMLTTVGKAAAEMHLPEKRSSRVRIRYIPLDFIQSCQDEFGPAT